MCGGKKMQHGLSALQASLGFLFLYEGFRKVSKTNTYNIQSPADMGRFIFITLSEFLFSVGLILLLLLRVSLWFTAITACLSAVLMFFAARHHFLRNENKEGWITTVMSLMSILVVCGSF
jgi:hypothetical protein